MACDLRERHARAVEKRNLEENDPDPARRGAAGYRPRVAGREGKRRTAALPADVEVRRSSRRRRTVTAYRENGRTIVLVPARMANNEIARYVEDLVRRLDARDRRTLPDDDHLRRRAEELSARFLHDKAQPSSVRWVTNQRKRWGSCTPVDGSIRLSTRLQGMPDYVIDYVLLHELAHLLVPGHGEDFEALMSGFPQLEQARCFLDGVSFAEANFVAQQEPEEPGQVSLF
jgi:predicted metal-dependent hydrolase